MAEKLDKIFERRAPTIALWVKFISAATAKYLVMYWGVMCAAIWAFMPWFFSAVYDVHKFDHADPFWLGAAPVVLASFIPMWFSHSRVIGFPLGWVIVSSVFNLTVGLLLGWLLQWAAMRRK